MVPDIRRLLRVLAVLALSFRQCHASTLNSDAFSRQLSTETISITNKLEECETLKISPPSDMNIASLGSISYHILTVEANGQTTSYPLGNDVSSLYWTTRHPGGTQLFLALVDSFGTPLSIRPVDYSVSSISRDCQSTPNTARAALSSQPKISSAIFSQLLSCTTWELSVSGGKAPYRLSIVGLESGTLYNYSISEEHIFSYTHNGDIAGQMIGTVSDANGIFSTTPIVDFIDPTDIDHPSYSSGAYLCGETKSSDLRQTLHPYGPPPPRRFKYTRTLHEEYHMHRTRSTQNASLSYKATIALAVCSSVVGGIALMTMVVLTVMYRKRKSNVIAGQDVLPRPFEMMVPAPTATFSSISYGPTSVPMSIASNNRVQGGVNGGLMKGRGGTKEKTLEKSVSSSTGAASSSQAGSSGGKHTLHRDPSYTSSQPNDNQTTVPSLSRSSSRSQALGLAESSRTSPGQSTPPVFAQTHHSRPTGVTPTRSLSVGERRSAKRADALARSASEQYRAAADARGYLSPDFRTHQTSSRHVLHAQNGNADMLACPTNHPRHSRSAPRVLLRRPVEPDVEPHAGEEMIFEHRDAGVMHELPPPYHKVNYKRSKVAV